MIDCLSIMGSRTLVGTGSDGLGEVEPGERKPAADVEAGTAPNTVSPRSAMADQTTAESTGQGTESAATTTVRPTRPTPGGSALAALLTQNRAKTGRADGGDGSGPVPNPTRSTHSSGSFDLLDITAVGDGGGEKKVEDSQAKRSVQVRATRLTPATGGLPALLAQTGRESGRSGDGDGKVMAPISTRLTPSVPGFPATVDPPSGRTVVAKKAEPADNSDDSKVSEVSGKTGDQSLGVETTSGAGAKDPSAPRPMRLTPGSGGLAALLAQTRSRTGKHETLEKKIPGSASEVATPRFDSSRPAESAAPAAPAASAASAASAAPAESGAVISVPQEKSGNFASTLMGVPAPEINLARPLEVVRQPAPSGRTIKAGSPQKAGDAGSTASDGAGDRARVGSAERFRTTELIDTVGRARRSRIVVGGAVAAAVIVLALVLIPSRKPKPTEQTSRAVPAALPAAPLPVTAEPGVAPSPEPTVPSAAGEETAAKDDVQEKARLAAQQAKAEAKAEALAEALAAKAAKAEKKKQALAEAKAAKAAKEEEKKQALAAAKAAKAAKAEEKKQAVAEAKEAKAKALKAEVDKQAPAETKTAKGGRDEEGKEAVAAAKAAKADAQKQARAEVKAAKLAKAEAQKQARAEARAAKAAAKAEAQAGGDNGVPWDGSSAGSGPGIASRRPASLSETSKSKSSVPARVWDDPDATLPLSTR